MVSARSKTDLKAIFVSGARPNETDFSDLIDSYTDYSELLQYIGTALSNQSGVLQVTSASATAYSILPESLGGTGEGSMASALTAFGFASAGAVAGFAQVGSANNFTKDQIIISSATDANEGPGVELDRRSDSAADGDKIGYVRLKGRNSINASTTYSKIRGAIVNASAGNETGSIEFISIVSGASATRMIQAKGLYSVSASGGDQGLNTLNFSELYADGVRIEATVLDTEKATTTGTAVDFTSPFTTTTGFKVLFTGVGVDGSDNIIVQLGDSGGIETSDYNSISVREGTNGVNAAGSSSGLIYQLGGGIARGRMVVDLEDAANNTYVASHAGTTVTTGDGAWGGGDKSLSDTLTTVRITPTGSDNFDAGAVNIRWYGY